MAFVASISRRELGRLFDLTDDLIDSLIASGRILCHVRDGETRIPIDQLEAFFRDGLMRVYQTEAWFERARANGDALAGGAPAPPPARAPAPHQEEGPPEEEPPPAVIVPISVVHEPEKMPEPAANSRTAPRFIPRRQVDGIFKDIKFTILQISATGFRIRHTEPLIPGDEAKLTFALLNPARSFVVRARVVWTSVARYDNDDARTFCISGLRVTSHGDRVANAISILQTSHELQPESAGPKTSTAAQAADVRTLDGISDDEVALVVKAAQRFATDPQEASRWYGRARFAMSDEAVRRDAPRKPREREEVLGIWEYLERQMAIGKIAGVLNWMRKTRQANA